MMCPLVLRRHVSARLDARQHGCYAAAMGILQCATAALAWSLTWLGQRGAPAVGVCLLIGMAVPPLGALVRPIFPETVFALLCLAFLRVDPAALRHELTQPRRLILAALWAMVAVPVLTGVLLVQFGVPALAPALTLAMMFNMVAPPTFSSPALAALMGLNAAVSLAMLLVCVAVTPVLAPALIAAFAGDAVSFAPTELGVRLILMIAGAALFGTAVRAVAGKTWVARQAVRIDGLNVVVLLVFAIGLMGDVLSNLVARPMLVLGLLALGTAATFGLTLVTALLFGSTGLRTALPLAHATGSRNTGLMLAAAAGSVPELVWLYVALIQIPIYAMPLIARPLLRRWHARQEHERDDASDGRGLAEQPRPADAITPERNDAHSTNADAIRGNAITANADATHAHSPDATDTRNR